MTNTSNYRPVTFAIVTVVSKPGTPESDGMTGALSLCPFKRGQWVLLITES